MVNVQLAVVLGIFYLLKTSQSANVPQINPLTLNHSFPYYAYHSADDGGDDDGMMSHVNENNHSIVHLLLPSSGEGGINNSNDKGRALDVDTNINPNLQIRNRSHPPPPVEITGMSFEYDSDKKRIDYDEAGSPLILENLPVVIRLYGKFDNTTYFKLSKFRVCDDPNNHERPVKVEVDSSGTEGVVKMVLPTMGELSEVFLCLKSAKMENYMRQGEVKGGGSPRPYLVIRLRRAMLPLWLHLVLLVVLISLSGLLSGLNLGLMSLNKTDLKIVIKTGTIDEQKYASTIAPVRNHGNLLLCCIVFGNVLLNSSLTILMDDLTSGLIAIIVSTLAIVMFGEIIPQAICSRYGLAIGAKTIYLTKFFMCVTFPLAYPVSKVLDLILGEEIGSVYTRERLKELLRVTKDHHGLENEEVGIISGALDMRSKTVKDVMVNLEKVFMLPIDSVLDFDTFTVIECQGYSRIPVYNEERSNIVGLLNVKQLTLLDANDNIPLKTVIEYYQNQLFFVFENTRLDYMFRSFREGSKGHMAFVQRISDEGPGDPFYQTIGLVTFEDVLEELLQAEIMDESDIGKHENRLQTKRQTLKPFHLATRKPKMAVELPAPLALAAVQFLSTSVEAFKKDLVSNNILQRLIRSCAVYTKLPKDKVNQQLPEMYIYEHGKPADYFVMILEGKVEVTVGREKLSYEAGAFTTFGKDLLQVYVPSDGSETASPVTPSKKEEKRKPRTFVPDYTVKIVTDVHYAQIKLSAYKAAVMATVIENSNMDPSKDENRNWQDELEKVLESVSTTDEENALDSGMSSAKL